MISGVDSVQTDFSNHPEVVAGDGSLDKLHHFVLALLQASNNWYFKGWESSELQ